MDRKKTYGSFIVVFGAISGYPKERNARSESATYKVAGHSWYLALFPGGDESSGSQFNKNYNTACWVLCSTCKYCAVRASCNISVLDGKGNKVQYVAGPATTFLNNSGWKCSNFLSHTYLSTGNYIINDTLTILVELTVYGPLEESKHFIPCLPSKTLTEDIKHLLFDASTTDVVIVAAKGMDKINTVGRKSVSEVKDVLEGEHIKIPAHKFILSMRSPVFRTMFASGMAEALTNEVRIQDFDAAVVKEFLRFLYTDLCEVDKHAEQLLAAAFKYEVPGLCALCQNYLGANVRVGNVVNILYLSDLYNLEHLQQFSLRYIAEHAKEIVLTELTLHVMQAELSPELSQKVLHALAGTVQSK